MSVCSIKTHVGNIIPRGALLFHSLFVYTNFYASILMVKNHESSFISLELCSLNIIPTLQLKKLLGFYTSCFSVSTKKSWHIYKGKRLAIRAGSKPTYYRQKVPCIHHFHAWNLKEIRKLSSCDSQKYFQGLAWFQSVQKRAIKSYAYSTRDKFRFAPGR